jgi:arylsulfatase A
LTPQPPDKLPPTSNSPLREGKGHLYEGGIRVPLLIKWPGVARPGTVCDAPVISNDLYPTMVEMAGIEQDPGNPADGLSLTPLLKGRGTLKRDTLYWHWPHYAIAGALPASAIRRGDYKLIEFLEDGCVELYDLAKDLGEQNDLSPTMVAKREELLGALRRWRQSLNAGTMRPNPDYRPEKATGRNTP